MNPSAPISVPDEAPLPGAPFLAYQGDALTLEDVPLAPLAERYGTPLFVYSKAALLAALAAWQRGLAGRDARICYAVKANPALAILRILVQAGCGFDIVSAGELERVLRAGARPDTVLFSGIGKTRAEMQYALQAGIGCFNVESLAELDALDTLARSLGRVAPVSIRVNPDVDAHTHPYISTGMKNNKFGIAHEQALAAYQHAARLPGLRVAGIDCHIGSQITEAAPYLEAMDRLLDLVAAIEAAGIPIGHIDFGGGLGINYTGLPHEQPLSADTLWHQLLARLDARGYGNRRLFTEPGRSLIGNAGLCLMRVLYLKPGEHKNFCIVDAAMNDLPRPALYGAYHRIVPLAIPAPDVPRAVYDVVGPVCESGDWLGRERTLAVRTGDALAMLSAGAYCMSMASNYNARARAAEVLIENGTPRLIRERETAADLWRLERL